ARFAGPRAGVAAVAFPPGGQSLVAACHDGTVKLWDLTGGKETASFAGHKKGITEGAASPDGRTLATAGADLTLKPRDPPTRREVRSIAGLKAPLISLVFSPDSTLLAGAGASRGTAPNAAGEVKLWDAATGAVQTTVPGSGPLAFTPDGTA